jgi:hypothetical protein
LQFFLNINLEGILHGRSRNDKHAATS